MFPGDKAPIWEAFRAAADTDLPTAKFDMMAHDAFMERAKKAFAVVQTGGTLRANGLVVLEEVFDISARLVVNKVSLKTKAGEILPLIDKMREIVG